MPLYRYECEGGHRFEMLRTIRNRHNVSCPDCKQLTHLIVSPFRVRTAEPVPVYSGDGTKLYEFRDSEKMRPPTPPEELVRLGELPNNADRFEPRSKEVDSNA